MNNRKTFITTLNKIWINNTIDKELFIDKDEAIPNGWVKGRLKSNFKSHSSYTKGKKCYNNGEVSKYFSNQDSIPNGFIEGRLGSSEETKEKLSKSHLGLHHSDETKKKISLHSNNNRDKAYKTIIKKYGSLTIYYKQLNSKGNITKKKKGNLNTSKPEEDFYNQLLEEYQGKEVLRQYKDKERYPFYCDFYIPSEDLFIELNRHWSHGEKPFDPEDKECQEKLALWQEKAKQSQFYQNAIQTWTIRDVEKAKVAKENNLNYKVIY